jgi:ribosome-associated heat shock protein Hsp15
VVTVALDRAVRVLKVVGFAQRRGSPEAARALCWDMAAAERLAAGATTPRTALREPGAGRPTKRERRAIERFTGEDKV